MNKTMSKRAEKHQQMLLDHQQKKQERKQRHNEWKNRRYKKAIPLYCLN